ncbi:c-type cytochrome [Croceicoccus sediminis]|uniref:c-type cytochrome n=1 Tax=Croceicoccus sediminis TaxID=2571150 RepID=UPI0011845896|nr:cytochrome c [Croceicoccus sediminis]
MKRLASSVSAVIAVCIGGSLWAAEPANYPAPRAPEKIYAQTCGYCHGVNVGPVIRGRELPPEVTKAFVRMGPNAMPAFRETEISNEELDALATWLQQSEADPKERGQ